MHRLEMVFSHFETLLSKLHINDRQGLELAHRLSWLSLHDLRGGM